MVLQRAAVAPGLEDADTVERGVLIPHAPVGAPAVAAVGVSSQVVRRS